MDNAAEAPPVPLNRLRALGDGEADFYYGVFSTIGGSLDNPVAGASVAQVLETTGVPQNLLHKIWTFADEFNQGSLDWEGFCVACRLCAQVQQASDEDEAEFLAEGANVDEIPSAAPWFEGYDPNTAQIDDSARPPEAGFEGYDPNIDISARPPEALFEGYDPNGIQMHDGARFNEAEVASIKAERARRLSSGTLEFEALAFGGGNGETVRPAGDFGKSAMPMLPTPSAAGQWQGGVTSGTGGFLEANNAKGALGSQSHGDPEAYAGPDATPSAAVLTERLSLPAASSSSSKRSGNLKRDPVQLIAEELAQGRQKLEQSFADKRRLQRRLEKMRQRLESVRAEREEVVAELTNRQCDVQHLFAEIEFTRLQIEQVEHETGPMRAIQQAFSHDDISRMRETQKRFQSERISLGEDAKDLKDRRAMMQMAQDMLVQDRKVVAGLSDKLKRPQRLKMDLQSRQVLLLEDQRQAEEERSKMLHALEMERVRLFSVRSERMDIGTEMKDMLQEARKSSRDSGVEPAVFAKCFLPQRRNPPEMQEPLDPIAAPSSSAALGKWGPAAEYQRHGEDTSSWRRNVYQSGIGSSNGANFSVSGGYTDPTSMEKWAKFGGGGTPSSQKFYGHSQHHGGQHLGVPAGRSAVQANLAR